MVKEDLGDKVLLEKGLVSGHSYSLLRVIKVPIPVTRFRLPLSYTNVIQRSCCDSDFTIIFHIDRYEWKKYSVERRLEFAHKGKCVKKKGEGIEIEDLALSHCYDDRRRICLQPTIAWFR